MNDLIPLSKSRFIVLDTETTGQDPFIAIEMAGQEWVPGRPATAAHFQETYLDPQQKIDPSSQSVHHILDEDLIGAPLLAEVAPAWDDWVGDSPLIAYNADFDKEVLAATPLHGKRWLDAWRAAMHVWHIGQLNEDGFPLKSFKQQELRYWLRLPKTFGEAHRAAADIQVTTMLMEKVVEVYLECGNSDDFNAFMDWIDQPIQHLTLPVGGMAFSGKTPEELEPWALKKAFDPTYYMFKAFAKFNVHENLMPEYQRRFGTDPPGFGKSKPPMPPSQPESQSGGYRPRTRVEAPVASSPPSTPSAAGRWVRQSQKPS